MPSRKKSAPINPRAMLSPQKRAAIAHAAVFSSLPAEIQARIPTGPARQRFNAAFDRLSRQRSSALRSMRGRDIGVIARAAAGLAAGDRAMIARKTAKKGGVEKRLVVSRQSPYYDHMPEFERAAWAMVPQRQRVVLASGARGEFFAALGRSVPGLMPGEPQAYISFRPFFDEKKYPNLKARLRFRHGTDFIEQIRGSVYFVAAKFHREPGQEKPVLVVWNDQPRLFNSLPESLRGSYRGLHFAFFDYLEGVARLGGADRIAFASPEHAKNFLLNIEFSSGGTDYRRKKEALRENVVAHYQRLEGKLLERGYKKTELNLGLEDKGTKAPFLVKELE